VQVTASLTRISRQLAPQSVVHKARVARGVAGSREWCGPTGRQSQRSYKMILSTKNRCYVIDPNKIINFNKQLRVIFKFIFSVSDDYCYYSLLAQKHQSTPLPSSRSIYFPEIRHNVQCQFFSGLPNYHCPLTFITEILNALLLSSVYFGILTSDN
jgi:hypothetical protein